jgi:hypothetical protein
MELYK